MSVTIRLAKVGKRNAPTYKIVVANTRDKRNGRYLDLLGYYNPSVKPPELKLDENKYQEWKTKGALSTDAVEKLRDGTYEFKPYAGSKAQPESDKPTQETEPEKETTEEQEEDSSDEEK